MHEPNIHHTLREAETEAAVSLPLVSPCPSEFTAVAQDCNLRPVAGVHKAQMKMDSRVRGNDGPQLFSLHDNCSALSNRRYKVYRVLPSPLSMLACSSVCSSSVAPVLTAEVLSWP